MTAAELGFDSDVEWLDLKQKLERHNLVLPAIIQMLQPFFVFTERFSAYGNWVLAGFVCELSVTPYLSPYSPLSFLTGVTIHLVRRAVFEMRDLTKPIEGEVTAVARIRSVLHEAVCRRFANVLADTDRTVLMAAFLHPDTCKDLLTWEPAVDYEPSAASDDSESSDSPLLVGSGDTGEPMKRMVLSSSSIRLIFGDGHTFDGVADA